MKTSNTLHRSHLESEYPIHIQQALYLISGVLRRIAEKQKDAERPVQRNVSPEIFIVE